MTVFISKIELESRISQDIYEEQLYGHSPPCFTSSNYSIHLLFGLT